jgi:C4-dicarboxylate-specific signal transduction histidine kinase
MSKISKQLKFFMRSNDNELHVIDVRETINKSLELLSSDLKKDSVKIILNYDDQPYLIKGEKIRMEQVFINLINNARFAMQESKDKQIMIDIEVVDSDSPDFNFLTNIAKLEEPVNKALIITIKDTGKGMTEDILEELFDPFFTTKPSGRSLGLGLTISSNIIHEFKGTLTASNNTEKGACFVISLPLNQ